MFDRGTRGDRFRDRADAGATLAEEILDRDVSADIVLAIPRGGLPLGRAVADALDTPLDIVVASKIGAPDNPEYAIGAVARNGNYWLDEETINRLGVDRDYLEQSIERETTVAREKAKTYRASPEPPDLTGKTVLIVDDGVATGSTARAAIHLARADGTEAVHLAIPVGPPDTVADLETEANSVICLLTPRTFSAVGQFYERFDQVTDEEAISYLEDGDR